MEAEQCQYRPVRRYTLPENGSLRLATSALGKRKKPDFSRRPSQTCPVDPFLAASSLRLGHRSQSCGALSRLRSQRDSEQTSERLIFVSLFLQRPAIASKPLCNLLTAQIVLIVGGVDQGGVFGNFLQD